MISGTSRILSKFGPVDLLIITITFQKIKKFVEWSLVHIILRIWKSEKFRNLGNLRCPLFECWIVDFLCSILQNENILKTEKVRDEDRRYIQFASKNLQSLDANFTSIKKHESVLYKNEPTFLFLSKAIPITNQRTDSHPHPCTRMKWRYLISRLPSWFLCFALSFPMFPWEILDV